MNRLASILLIAPLLAQTAAQATVLSPPNTHFTAKGRVTLTTDSKKAVRCSVKMRGDVDGHGRGKIRSFTLGGKAEECSAVPTGLPWAVKAQGPINAYISGFGYQDSVAPCRTQTIIAEVSKTGEWTVNECLNGVLTTTPPITIVRPE